MKRKVINKLLAICLSVSMITAAIMPMTAAASELPTDKATETAAEGVAASQSEGVTEAATTAGVTLYKVKVVLPKITSATKVKTLSVKQNGKDYTYDASKLTTDDKGVLYLMLPANATGQTTAITVNDVKFAGTVKTNDDNVLSEDTKTTETTDSEKGSEETGSTTAATEIPETELQATDAQTEEVKNMLPETEETSVAETTGPTEAETVAPETVAPETTAPETKAPETSAPETTDNKKEDVQNAELTIEQIESFGSLEYGSDFTARPIKITNIGNAPTKIKSVEVSDKNAFIITPDNTSVDGIDIGVGADGKYEGYTIKPNTRSAVSRGTYHATVKVVYEGGETVSNDVSFSLTKRELTVASLSVEDRTYNGKKEVAVKEVKLNGVVSGDDVKATAVGTMKSANAEGKTGFSSVKYELTGTTKDNYTFVESNVATSFKINPVELMLSGSIDDKKYDGKLTTTGSYKLTVLNSEDNAIFKAERGSALKEKVTYEFTDANAGIDKKAMIKIVLGNKNYRAVSLDVTATIEKAKNPADNKKGVKEPKITKSTYNTLEFEVVSGQEYKITGGKYGKDGSEWSTTNSFKDLTAKTEYEVKTRLAETKNYLVGKTEVTKTQTTLRNPIISSAQNNKITGVSASYGKGATLKFTATGAITNSPDDSLDDVRYTPIKWSSYANGLWDNNEITSQSGSFPVNNIGTYNLTVTFMKQTYNGTTWVNNEAVTDTKTISYKVVTAGTGAVNAPKANTTKTGVKTGDYNPIILLAVLLVISGGTVVVLVLTKKRKKNRN